MKDTNWTKELIATMADAASRGLSASLIAAEISEAAGHFVSRSAVIGKCHRIGVVLRGASTRPRGRPDGQARRTPDRMVTIRKRLVAPVLEPVPDPVVETVPFAPLSLLLDDLTSNRNQCRYITSASGEATRYCCLPVETHNFKGHKLDGCSWCPTHYRRVYLRPGAYAKAAPAEVAQRKQPGRSFYFGEMTV